MPQPQTILTRVKNAFNAFLNRDPTGAENRQGTSSYGTNPSRIRMRPATERSIVAAIYNRLGIDVASIDVHHVREDQNGSFLETIDSGLNYCLTSEANIDQTGRAFIQDVVMSMLDDGTVAIVPIDTTDDPKVFGAYDIQTMRTGRVVEWYPNKVRLSVYNDRTGLREELTLPKTTVAVIENPLYAVMNQPNSTLRRLTHKLNLLDAIDEQSSNGKLDLIVQLPYTIRSDERRRQANERHADIEAQLTNSQHGVAYLDATEKITQLNRPIENNLMVQIEYLTKMLYAQLGITETVLDGTADDKVMLNYFNRSIKPIVSAITESMERTFLTRTARSQKQAIRYFADPFRLVPTAGLAELADKLTRNEILSSNEFRAIIGFRPSDAPGANDLRNKNLNVPLVPGAPPVDPNVPPVTPAVPILDTPVSEVSNN